MEAVALPAAGSATLWIGLGLGQWGYGGGEPRIPSRLPHLLFIGTVRRGPPAIRWLDVPDQDAVKGSVSTVGSRRMRSIVTKMSFMAVAVAVAVARISSIVVPCPIVD